MNKKVKNAPEEETEETTEEEAVEEETEEATEEEAGKESEKDEEAAIDDVAEKISKALDLDALKEKIDSLVGREAEVAKKIFSQADVKKDKADMTKDEKIVGFFQALVTNDVPAIKALSEG